MSWQSWKPGFNADRKLKDVLAEMPRDNADKIPWQVWLLENPDSPLAFPGAITLFRHDCMHALLCTSFYAEDEAYTVGFTMGTSKWLHPWFIKFFLWLTTWFYTGEYRWNRELKAHFLDGFHKGQTSGMFHLNEFPFEDYTELTVEELRKLVGVGWINSPANYKNWAEHWPADRFEKYKHLRNVKPEPGKKITTFLLRRIFRRKNASN